MNRAWLIDRLDVVALRLGRLTVSHRDPERFFIERSDLVDDIRHLIFRLQAADLSGFREARAAAPPLRTLSPCERPKENNKLGGKGE